MSEIRSVSPTGGEKGVKLERFDLIPIGPLTALARHYGRGALKYDNHQWRKGYEWSKSYAALLRHLTEFWNGQDYDVCPVDRFGCADFPGQEQETKIGERGYSSTCYNHTGSHHLDAVMWHAFTLREFFDKFQQYDDRYVWIERTFAQNT